MMQQPVSAHLLKWSHLYVSIVDLGTFSLKEKLSLRCTQIGLYAQDRREAYLGVIYKLSKCLRRRYRGSGPHRITHKRFLKHPKRGGWLYLFARNTTLEWLGDRIRVANGDARLKQAFETDTPISNLSWGYMPHDQLKSADFLIHQLVDVVSKNGNLLLNVGPRPDGTISDDVRATLLEIGAWLGNNGEAIYGTHPWKVFGEGPTQIQTGFGHDADTKPYTVSDFRFTAKGSYVYAISMACPTGGTASIHSLGTGPQGMGYQIFNLSLPGSSDKVDWVQHDSELDIKLPKSYDCKHGFALRSDFGFARQLVRRERDA